MPYRKYLCWTTLKMTPDDLFSQSDSVSCLDNIRKASRPPPVSVFRVSKPLTKYAGASSSAGTVRFTLLQLIPIVAGYIVVKSLLSALPPSQHMDMFLTTVLATRSTTVFQVCANTLRRRIFQVFPWPYLCLYP